MDLEKKKERDKQYYQDHKEQKLKSVALWQKNNPEKCAEKNKKWREKNREKILEYQRKIREKKKNTSLLKRDN